MKKNSIVIMSLIFLLPSTVQPGLLGESYRWLVSTFTNYARENPKTFTALVGLSSVTLFSYARARARKAEHDQIALQRDNSLHDIRINLAESWRLGQDIINTNAKIDDTKKKTDAVTQEIRKIEKSINDEEMLQKEHAAHTNRIRENIAMAKEELNAKNTRYQALCVTKDDLQKKITTIKEEKTQYSAIRNTRAQTTVTALLQQK